MPTDRGRIIRWYTEHHDEWERLESDVGTYEWATVTRRLHDWLPPPPARVLDLGGGPGRYSVWLAQRGWQPVLADIVPILLDQALQRATDARLNFPVIQADAANLSGLADRSFDAVIALGPFYCLLDPAERAQAAREIARVAAPNAPVAVMFLNRSTGFLDNLAGAEMAEFRADWTPTWNRIFDEGVFVSPDGGSGPYAADNYSVWPSQLRAELEPHGFVTQAVVGCEGPLIRFGSALELAADDAAAWEFLWRMAYRFEEHPDFLVFSPHLLWLGRAPA